MPATNNNHAHAFHEGPEEFAVPEEPVAEETADAFHNEQDSPSGTVDLDAGEGNGGKDDRPWYRRPSPWWCVTTFRLYVRKSGIDLLFRMLVLMPITAMAMAGVSPALLDMYTELACRHLQRSRVTNMDLGYATNFSLSRESHRQTSFLRELYPIANDYASYDLFAEALPAEVMLADEPIDCGSNKKVQKAVSKLMLSISSTMGILGCITAASWSSVSIHLYL